MGRAALMSWREIGDVVGRSGRVDLAMDTGTGVHVTPELAVWWQDRLWVVVARRTLKARVLRSRPRVGACAVAGERAAVVIGDTVVLDPLRPWGPLATPASVPTAVLDTLWAGSALTGYAWTHRRNLSAIAGDAAGRLRAGRLGAVAHTLAPRLALVVHPRALALLDDGQVTWTAGAWPGDGWRRTVRPVRPSRSRRAGTGAGGGTARAGAMAAAAGDPDVPDRAAALINRPRSCAVGWLSPVGPVAMPGRWDPASGTAETSADLFRLAGLETPAPGGPAASDLADAPAAVPPGPQRGTAGDSLAPPAPDPGRPAPAGAGRTRRATASVTLEEDVHAGPDGKRGLLVRGTGTAVVEQDRAVVALDPDRVTWWDGTGTGTTDAG